MSAIADTLSILGFLQQGDPLETAIARLLSYLGEEPSHGLCPSVLEYLSAPRFCACPDYVPEFSGAAQRPRWLKSNLAWARASTFPAPFTDQLIQQAFSAWGPGVTPLRFAMSAPATCDILLTWGAIDGPSNILAWSGLVQIPNQRITQKYDKEEGWDTSILALAVLTHEIGHALGLDHSNAGIMRPVYDRDVRTPQAADIARMQELYGPDTGPRPPVEPPTGGKPIIIRIHDARLITIDDHIVTPTRGTISRNVFAELKVTPRPALNGGNPRK